MRWAFSPGWSWDPDAPDASPVDPTWVGQMALDLQTSVYGDTVLYTIDEREYQAADNAALLAAGGAHDAFDLLERTPNINRRPALARWHAELGFAVGQSERACQTVNALIENRDAPDWLRRRAFCLAVDGQGAARQTTISTPACFRSRLAALRRGLRRPIAASILPWRATSSTRKPTRRPLPRRRPPGCARWGIRRISNRFRSPIRRPPLRLTGRERHHALEEILAQGRDREVAAVALGQMLADTANASRFIHVARHHGSEVETLPVTEATLAHGYDIALAAVIVGDLRAAARWRDALVDGPPRRPSPAALAGQPILETAEGQLVYADGTPVEAEMPEWVPPSPRRMVALDLSLAVGRDALAGGNFDAVLAAWLESQGDNALGVRLALAELGASLSGDTRLAVLGLAAAPTAPGLPAMEMAMRAGAKAETAMLAVSLLNRPETATDPVTFSRAIAALDAAGLRRQALALVLERVVARAR